jgi:hypothetical protein
MITRTCTRCAATVSVSPTRKGPRQMPHGCSHGLPCQRMPGEKIEIPTCPQCAKDKAARDRAALVDELAAFGGAGKDGAA